MSNTFGLKTSEIAVICFTSAKNLHERALSVNNTWLKNFEKGYLVGGNYYAEDLKMICLGDHVGEDYFSATSKQFYGLKAMTEKFPEAKWFFINGCDAWLDAANLTEALGAFDDSKDYFVGGNFAKRSVKLQNGEDFPFYYPSGGSGFALSNSLAKKLAEKTEFILEDLQKYELFAKGACDCTLAFYLLTLFNIKPSYVDGFYAVQPYQYPGDIYLNGDFKEVSEPVIDKPIAFHTLTIREMYMLDAGKIPKKPNFIDKFVDKTAKFLSRKLKTKRLVNTVLSHIYGRKTKNRKSIKQGK